MNNRNKLIAKGKQLFVIALSCIPALISFVGFIQSIYKIVTGQEWAITMIEAAGFGFVALAGFYAVSINKPQSFRERAGGK